MENITFEQALKALDEIIAKMESGNMGLEESVELYEKAMKLKDFCDKKLVDAKLKIEKIEQVNDGKAVLSDFNEE